MGRRSLCRFAIWWWRGYTRKKNFMHPRNIVCRRQFRQARMQKSPLFCLHFLWSTTLFVCLWVRTTNVMDNNRESGWNGTYFRHKMNARRLDKRNEIQTHTRRFFFMCLQFTNFTQQQQNYVRRQNSRQFSSNDDELKQQQQQTQSTP